MSIGSALDRLVRLGRDLNSGALVGPVDVASECANLFRVAEAIQEAGPRRVQTDSVTLDMARRRWNDCRPDLTKLHRREIRILCWDLTTALNPSFVQALQAHTDFYRKRTWVEGLAMAYFSSWRIMRDPERIERVLQAAAVHVRAGHGWLSLCGRHANDIFSARANVFLAQNALDKKVSVDQELARWGLEGHTQLREATIEAAIGEWVRRYLPALEFMHERQAFREIEVFLDHLLPLAGAASRQFYKAIESLILGKRVFSSAAVHDMLRAWILKNSRLGDPRDPTKLSNWNLVSPEAIQRFKSWLAKDDLKFFFEFVIPDRADPHGRKPFWLQYVDSFRVEDSRVVLCARDRDRLQRGTREQFSYGNISDSWDVSAFLMRFRAGRADIIVVEFSRTGNAIHIHDFNKFEHHVGAFRSAEFRIDAERGLKHHTHLGRFPHRPPDQWQQKVRAFLAGHGIRP